MFREADVGERELLDEMTLAGLRHWGHHEQHPEIYAGFAQMLAAEPGPAEHPVVVLEENERIVGFYELRDRGEDIELLRMFLRDDLIGRGYGRQLWDEAVRSASLTHQRMTIMSDPGSVGFYQAMARSSKATRKSRLGSSWVRLSST